MLVSAGFLLLASQATTPTTALVTLCCALAALGVSGSGFGGNHLDIAPQHADVLFSLSNVGGTIPGIIGVYATGLLLDLTGTYAATFALTAAINVIGAAVWYFWAAGEPILDEPAQT